MYEYAPWAKDVLRRILAISSNCLPILDLQFGGACNLACIYCDTPRYSAPCLLDLDAIERILSSGKIQWVYSCGLGEMTAQGNDEAFRQVLAMCKKNSIKVSIFSNIVNLDDELLGYIDEGILHILFKLDSFVPETMTYLYGANRSETMLRNYQRLLEVVHVKDCITNLGASIVPNTANFLEIPRIIDFNIEHGIFTLLGQLENAGKCQTIFSELALDNSQLMTLRQYAKNKYGVDCSIPVCPAAISAIHVTNTNRVIVDERSGLSCGWFWLDEPRMIEIGNIIDMSPEELTAKIIAYRKLKFPNVVSYEQSLEPNPFGGCGGDAKYLLQQYIGTAKY